MFKIEGIKIVCSFFLYRREKPKLKTAKQACGGARENGSCSHHPTPSTVNSSWKVKTKRPFQWRPQEQHRCPLHFQVGPGRSNKISLNYKSPLRQSPAAGHMVSMPLIVLALCPQTKKEGLLILGETRLFSLNQKAQLSKAKANHGSFT